MQYDKLGAGLASLFAAHQTIGKRGLRGVSELAITMHETDRKPARIAVSIECEETANFDHLAEYEIAVNQPTGSIRSAFLPIASLDALSEDPAVEFIHPARYTTLTMDMATQAVNVPAFISQTKLTGKGVVIGIIDSGIDPKHPAFQGRIVSIWDQTVAGNGVANIGGYGFEFTGADIVGSRDAIGHGTHVAGVAAGNDATYRGIAPDAKLVIVKTDLRDTSIQDGIRYIFAKAKTLGMAAVVNLSLRTHANPHDGSDIFSRLVDAQSGAGRIVCAAAGNDGGDGVSGGIRLHAEVPLTQGESEQIIVSLPGSSAAVPLSIVTFVGWYARADTVEVSLSSPAGSATGLQQPEAGSTATLKRYSLDGKYRVEIETPVPRAKLGNGDKSFIIRLSALGSTDAQPLPIAQGFWKIHFKGIQVSSGTPVDLWSTSDSPTGVQFIAPLKFLTDRKKIGVPAAAAQAIAVASYTTRTQWTSENGTVQTASGISKDAISPFSSPGPLRNGKPKPDVTAPGAFVIATLSRDSHPDPMYVVDALDRASAGTSVSTPFVVGVIALLLQKKPQLTPADVKQLLRKASHIPGKPPGSFDPKWGYGLLDVNQIPFP